jgi:hypothetical protein
MCHRNKVWTCGTHRHSGGSLFVQRKPPPALQSWANRPVIVTDIWKCSMEPINSSGGSKLPTGAAIVRLTFSWYHLLSIAARILNGQSPRCYSQYENIVCSVGLHCTALHCTAPRMFTPRRDHLLVCLLYSMLHKPSDHVIFFVCNAAQCSRRLAVAMESPSVVVTSDENYPEKFKSENFPFFYNDSWYG